MVQELCRCPVQQVHIEKNHPRRIGLLGGTFNPVHLGHVAMAKRAAFEFALEQVIFIPVGLPPHKRDAFVADKEDRYCMLKAAVESEPGMSVSRVEMDRGGYTYTIDTLKELKNIYAEYELCFIVGADTLFEIETWKDFDQVVKYCSFIVFYREAYDVQEVSRQAQRLWLLYGAKVELAEFFGMDISSTQIREAAKKKQDLSQLVPKGVAEYIIKNGVYD